MAEPPSPTGAVQNNVTCALPLTPDTPVGGSAKVAGVTPLDALESAPVPTLLIAATLNVYAVPLLSPVTVQLVDVDVGALVTQVPAPTAE